MVSETRSKCRIVIVGADSALGRDLCQKYANDTNEVIAIESTGGRLEDVAAACGDAPVDLLIFADALDMDAAISTAGRAEMRDLLYRLTYAPFKLAALLRPAVAAAKGSVLLCSRETALMQREAVAGCFIDRPFRAAAHALWKCLEVEWRGDDIRMMIVALRDSSDGASVMIEAGRDAGAGLLVDAGGAPLGW